MIVPPNKFTWLRSKYDENVHVNDGWDLRSVQKMVRCNQMPIAAFAAEYGFSQVAQYLGAENNEPVLAVLSQ